MSAARFRPPDNFGGWAPLGLAVSGRIDLNDDMQANKGAMQGGHKTQPQVTSQPARSRGGAPDRVLQFMSTSQMSASLRFSSLATT
jgi:hypothetical protein